MQDFNAQITFSAEVGEVLKQLENLSKAATTFGGASAQAQAQLQTAVGRTETTIRSLQGRLTELYAQRSKGDQTEALQKEIALTEKAVQGLQGELKKMQGVLPQVGQAATQMGASGSSGVLQMAQAFGLAQVAVGAIKWVVEEVRQGIVRFVETGLHFNKTIETAQIGIGALVATQNDLVGADGRALEGQEKLNAGMALGEEQVKKLRLASFTTIATFEELTWVYQQALGPMQGAGVKLDESVKLTQMFAQAAGALGFNMQYLGVEMRQIFSGAIDARNTPIASLLHITAEDVKKWKESGTVVEELTKRLEFFGLAGQRMEASWQGVTSNVQHFFQAFTGESIQPLFQGIKEGLHGALHDAFDLTTGEFSEGFQGLVEAGKTLFGELGTAIGESLKWAVQAVKDMSAWFQRNREDVTRLGQDLRIVAGQVVGIILDLVRMGGALSGSLDVLEFINLVLEGIGLAVAVVRDVVAVIAGALVELGTTLVQVVLAPVQLVLLGIAAAMDFVKKGSGEALAKVAEDIQAVINKGHGLAYGLVQPFADGTNAVAKYGDALLDADQKLAQHTAGEQNHNQTLDQKKARLKGLQDEIRTLEQAQAQALASSKTGTLQGTKEIEDRAKKMATLRDEALRLQAQLGQLKTSPRPQGGKDKLDPNAQDAIGLRIQALSAAGVQKVTLAEKEQAETEAFLNKIKAEGIQISKAVAAGHISEAQAASDRAKLKAAQEKGLKDLQEKFGNERIQATAKIDAQLLAQEGQGYDRQLNQIQVRFTKLREEWRQAGGSQEQLDRINAAQEAAVVKAGEERNKALAQIDDQLLAQEGRGYENQVNQIKARFAKLREAWREAGGGLVQLARINADEAGAIAKAGEQRVETDIRKLRGALKELETEKGRSLNFDEKIQEIDRFAKVMGLAKDAVEKLKRELEQGQDGWVGWKAGIMDFVAKVQDRFTSFKNAAGQIFGGVASTIANTWTGIVTGAIKSGDIIKTVWKGVSTSIIQALADVGAKELVGWGISKSIASWKKADATIDITTEKAKAAAKVAGAGQTASAAATEAAASTTATTANTSKAASGFFSAYAGIPWVGVALALAAIATMMTIMKSITAHAVGGVVDHPTLGLIGEAGTEIVMPETNFREYWQGTLQMGASLARAQDAADGRVGYYNRLGSSYGQAAYDARRDAATGSDGGTHYHSHMEGALIVSESIEGQRMFDGHVQNSLARNGQWAG